MRVKDPSAEPRSWTIIMKEQKVRFGENEIISSTLLFILFYYHIGFQKRTSTNPSLRFAIWITRKYCT